MENETKIEAINLESLANQAMYVVMSFGRFGNTRKAKIEETNTTAVQSRFSHNKKLLVSPELNAITKADNAIKALVETLCLPSKHDLAGLRMAPNKNIVKIAGILKEYKLVGRPALVAELLAVYPKLRLDAEAELKEHFDYRQFPTIDKFAEEFTFSYAFVNFGVPQNLQNISPELFEEQQAENAAQFKNSMDEVANTLLASFSELVTKLNDGLNGKSSVDGKKKSLIPSHVEKLNEFIAGFDAMSSFAPAVLKAEVEKVKQLMVGVDVAKIRESDNLKADLTAKIGQVAKTMVAQGDVKGRFFREDVPDTVEVKFDDGTTATATGVTEAVTAANEMGKLGLTMADLLLPSDETLEKVSPGCTKK